MWYEKEFYAQTKLLTCSQGICRFLLDSFFVPFAWYVFSSLLLLFLHRNNIRTARSNTQMSFDNLSFDGDNSGQRNFEFEDMTDFEVLRSNIVNSIKRKASAFSISASKDVGFTLMVCDRSYLFILRQQVLH